MCCVYSLFVEVGVTALTLKFPQRRWSARSRANVSSLRQPMCGSNGMLASGNTVDRNSSFGMLSI